MNKKTVEVKSWNKNSNCPFPSADASPVCWVPPGFVFFSLRFSASTASCVSPGTLSLVYLLGALYRGCSFSSFVVHLPSSTHVPLFPPSSHLSPLSLNPAWHLTPLFLSLCDSLMTPFHISPLSEPNLAINCPSSPVSTCNSTGFFPTPNYLFHCSLPYSDQSE